MRQFQRRRHPRGPMVTLHLTHEQATSVHSAVIDYVAKIDPAVQAGNPEAATHRKHLLAVEQQILGPPEISDPPSKRVDREKPG